MQEKIIHEVGLRDGLQMEKTTVPTEKKIEWTNKLIDAGIDIIQLGSFVHPTKVPQMADTNGLCRHFINNKPKENITFSGLVLNEKGMERGMDCGVEMFCMGVSASETHSQKNTRMTTAEATERIINMAKEAMSSGKSVQVSVQSAFGCGFEGEIPEERVLGIVDKYLENGIRMISLADTAGHGNPYKVESLFTKIKKAAPEAELACHFHNTYGLGLANIFAAMNSGVKYYETAFGGLGGCPFTKTAAGNVCTEDFIHTLHRSKDRTDVNLIVLNDLAKDIAGFFGKELPGLVYKTGGITDTNFTN